MSRILPMITMLLVALALMAYMAYRANDAETAVPVANPTQTEPMENQTDTDKLLTAVDHEQLSRFVDHARGPDIDRDAFFHLLKLARDNPPETVRKHARSDVTFAMLLDDPDRYRGEILSLRGRLRRLIQYPAPPNEYGIPITYEGWLYTQDARQFPYTLIFATPPEGIPTGTAIHVNCEVVGYFLGWWRYDTAEGKPTSAPYIMVSSIRKLDSSLPSRGPAIPMRWVAIATAIVATVVLFAVSLFAWRSLKSTPPRLTVDTSAITFQETVDVDSDRSGPDPSEPHSNGKSQQPNAPESLDLNS